MVTSASRAARRTVPRQRGNIGWALALSLSAGAVAWGLIEQIDPVFEVPVEFHVPTLGAPPEKLAAWRAELTRASRNNAVLYGSLVGSLLAVALSLRQVTWRHSPRLAAAALLGALGGTAAGLAASFLESRGQHATFDAQLTQAVSVQSLWWALIGVGVGLGVAIRGRGLQGAMVSTLGGLAAGAAAGMLYPVGMSILMPDVDTLPVIPLEAGSRLIWIGLAAGIIGSIMGALHVRPVAAPIVFLPQAESEPARN